MSEPRTFTLDEIEQRTGFDKRTIAYYVQQGLLPKVGRRGPKTRYPQLFMDRLQFVNMIRKKQDLGELGSLTLSDIRDILNQVSPETIAGVVAGEDPLKKVKGLGTLAPLVPTAPTNDAPPQAFSGHTASAALAEESAEITEALMDPSLEKARVIPDLNRKVRLGLLDANSAPQNGAAQAVRPTETATPARPGPLHTNGGDFIRPPRRYEDEIKNNEKVQPNSAPPPENEAETTDAEAAPPSIEIERLGWFLARLQRAMTGDRRRRTGTTESWHRALVTPELTISARNLKDTDAYMLDAVARILKKLLWEAWEE